MLINNIQKYIKGLHPLLWCLWALAGSITATGQQTDSLASYLKEAAAGNPGLRAKYSMYLAALEKVPQVGALPDPEVQFGYFIKPMELMEGYQRADFRIMQMAPWFGSLQAARDEASKMALARYQEMLGMRNDLFLQVKSSWYQVYRTTREIGITEKNLSLLRSLERMAIIRFKSAENSSSPSTAGMTPNNGDVPKPGSSGMPGGNMGGTSAVPAGGGNMPDPAGGGMGGGSKGGLVSLLRVQIEIGSIENRISLLQDQLKTEKQRFNRYLNRKPGTEVHVPDSLPVASLPGTLALLADSIMNNPMIRMYEADREANEARIRMADRMGYPMVGIGLNYTVIQKFPDVTSDMNGKDMVMPMIAATVPIYRKKYRALRREAGYLRDAAAESVINARNDLRVGYQEAVQLYQDAERRIELYNRQVSLAEKTLSLLTSSFSAAGTDFEEILRMQQQLIDYQFRHIEAVVDRNLATATIVSIISNN